ncbi:TonB-dependent receptor [bacterium]|nr:TonB-dependent receptor [bacterium]
MKNYFLFIIFSIVTFLHAQDKTVVSGRVMSKDTGRPLHGVNILVTDTPLGAVTDTSGCFTLLLEAGRYVLTFSHIGYEINTQSISLKHGDGAITLNIQLKSEAVHVSGTTITGNAEVAKILTYEIAARDVAGIASPLPDAMQTIKTLPGVFSVNDQSSFYNIRGGSYDDNLIRLNGVEIFQPLLVRKGIAENPSLVNPWLVESIRLHSGAYPVNWGDKLSSALDIAYRAGDRKRMKGMAMLSTVRAEAALEGPLGDRGSFIVAARKINYGYIYSGLRTKGSFSPDFKDVQASATLNVSGRNTMRLFGLMSWSKYYSEPIGRIYDLVEGKPISIVMNGKEGFNHQTKIAGLEWESGLSDKLDLNISGSMYRQNEFEDSKVAYSFFGEIDDSLFLQADSVVLAQTNRLERFDSSLEINARQLKMELTGRHAHHHWRVGMEYKSTSFADDVAEYVKGTYFLPGDPEEPLERRDAFSITGYSAFVQDRWQLSSICRMRLGLKYSWYDMNRENLFLPRWGIFITPIKNMEIALNIGRYAQPPLYKELRHTAPEDRSLVRAQKADQFILGLEKQWNHRKLSLKVEVFYRKYSDLISYDVYDVRTVYTGRNDSHGYAYGYDLHFRGQWTEDCLSWISYSYLIARENIENDGLGWLPRPSDQRHTISFKLEDKMVNYPGSRIFIRLLYGSGTPYTLFVSEQRENGEYVSTHGRRNAERLHFYSRFDVGLVQKLTVAGMTVTLREEVLNLFNNLNVMGFSVFSGKMTPHYLSGRTFQLGVQASW